MLRAVLAFVLAIGLMPWPNGMAFAQEGPDGQAEPDSPAIATAQGDSIAEPEAEESAPDMAGEDEPAVFEGGAIGEVDADAIAPSDGVAVLEAQDDEPQAGDGSQDNPWVGDIGTVEVPQDGVYYVGKAASGDEPAQTATGIINIPAGMDVVLVGPGSKSEDLKNDISVQCGANVHLTLSNIAICTKGYDDLTKDNINFKGGANTLTFGLDVDDEVLIDMDANASGYSVIHVPIGTSLLVNGPGAAYIYKREMGAGIGGHWGEVNGEITIGNPNNGSPDLRIFIKGSKQGAVIGSGANAGRTNPITINCGTITAIGVARGAIIGGSAGSDGAASGSTVTINGGSLNLNVDFSGAAIGGGGYAEGNDSDGGVAYINGGSIRTFIDQNAIGSWTSFGVLVAGVNDAAITALKTNAANGLSYTVVNDAGETLPADSVALIAFDTDQLSTPASGSTAFNVKIDDVTYNVAGLHMYKYINEVFDKDGQIPITDTRSNWVYNTSDGTATGKPNDTNLYLYASILDADGNAGGMRKVEVNGETFYYRYNTASKRFEATTATTSIASAAVSEIEPATFTGSSIVPDFTVTMDVDGEQVTLQEGTDYEVAYSDNVNAGTCTMTVTGIGSYSGTCEGSFTILPARLADATITMPAKVGYTGEELRPAATIVLGAGEGAYTLVDKTDYVISYTNNTEVGTATASFVGLGNFDGSTAVRTFEIVMPAEIRDADVTVAPYRQYTGNQITPAPVVAVDGETLVEGDDYVVTYGDNVEVGEASGTVVVTGAGLYTGVVEKTFEIGEAWDGSVDVSWYDPGESVYHISLPSQLAGAAALANGLLFNGVTTGSDLFVGDAAFIDPFAASAGNYYGGVEDFTGKTIVLDADFDMGGVEAEGAWTGPIYQPIGGQFQFDSSYVAGVSGTQTLSASFCGTFDGNGHYVRNVNCNLITGMGSQSIGLIGRAGRHDNDPVASRPDTVVVKSVAVTGYIRGGRSVGGIVGKCGQTVDGVTIAGCANYASVSGTDKKGVGGIAGAAWNRSHIYNCYNMGTVSNPHARAGIAGSNESTIANCYNVGLVGDATTGDPGIFTVDVAADVTNCYYLAGSAGVGYYGNNGSKKTEVTEKSADELKALAPQLGSAYVDGSGAFAAISDGYPVLWWQAGLSPVDAAEVSVEPIDDQTYTGSALEPEPVVSYGGTALVEGVDYALAYADNVNVGTATVAITPLPGGLLVGEKAVGFAIAPMSVDSLTFGAIADQEYTGSAITPDVLVQTPSMQTLVKGADYIISYKNNVNAGTATALVVFRGNVKGTKKLGFEIAPASLDGFEIAEIAAQSYSGAAIEPAITVGNDDVVLVEDEDFETYYFDNAEVGTASVLVLGLGNYEGTLEAQFAIEPASIGAATAAPIPDWDLVPGTPARPQVALSYNGMDLAEDVDYQVNYPKGVSVGQVVFTVEGLGNFTGSRYLNFRVNRGNLSDIEFSLPIAPVEFYGTAVTPVLEAAYHGVAVPQTGSYYNIDMTDNAAVGTGHIVRVTAGSYMQGLFSGVPLDFEIVPGDFSKCTIGAIPSQWVSPGSTKPAEPLPVVIDPDGTIVPASYYTVEYQDNGGPGTATLTVKSNSGSITGQASAQFEIVEKVAGIRGAGTEANPYQLASGADLEYAAEQVANTMQGWASAHYKVMNDFAATDVMPLGTNANPFVGHIDGDGHTITLNLDASASNAHTALVGVAANGDLEILDLTIDGSVTSGGGAAAAFVAKATSANVSISNCVNKAHVNRASTAASGNWDDAVGGFVAFVDANCNVTIEDSLNLGDIETHRSYGGGFVGAGGGNSSTVTIRRCGNEGNGIEVGNAFVAGFVGCDSFGSVYIDACYNKGSVSAGFVYNTGLNGSNADSANHTITITSSYNTGEVSRGGFVNQQTYYSLVLQNCYNAGVVTGGAAGSNAGAFASWASVISPWRLSADNLLYLEGSAAYGVRASSVGTVDPAIVLGAADLKAAAGRLGPSFVLGGSLNGGYPALWWEVDASSSPLIDISGVTAADLSDIADQTYNWGRELRPGFTVALGDEELVGGVDFIATYASNTKVGTGRVHSITGINGYTGTAVVDKEFAINAQDIANATVSLALNPVPAAMWYCGTPITVGISSAVMPDGTRLSANAHYEAVYEGNDRAGMMSLTLRGLESAGMTGEKVLFSDVMVAEGSTSLAGSGTAEDPYLISSKQDLEFLAYASKTADLYPSYADKTYKVTADIDARATEDSPAVELLFPSNANAFKGTFDGGGHTITVGVSATTSTVCSAFMGYANGATIENVTIDGTASNSMRNAAMAGILFYGLGDLTFRNVTNSVDIAQPQNAGAATGFVVNWNNASATFEDCVNEGSISAASGAAAGFFFSSPQRAFTMTRCVNRGAVSSTGNNGIAVGLIGQVNATQPGGKLVMGQCANLGAVSAPGNNGRAAGILYQYSGSNEKSELVDVYNGGAITLPETTSQSYGAGIVCYAYASKGGTGFSLENAYNSGVITADADGNAVVGAIVGYSTSWGSGDTLSFDIANSHYLEGSAPASAGAMCDEMHDAATVLGSDELKAAHVRLGSNYVDGAGSVNAGYPVFYWQAGQGAVDLSQATVEIPGQLYAGMPAVPDSVIVDGMMVLIGSGVNVESCTGNDVVGTATAELSGHGRYFNSATVSFDILPGDIAACSVDPIGEQAYTGAGIEPAVAVMSPAGGALVEGADYAVVFRNNVEAGMADATIIGNGNYTGAVSVQFQIAQGDLSRGSAALAEPALYAGSAATPKLAVTDEQGNQLVEGVDYVVAYFGNTQPGAASATVAGIGNYAGTKPLAFTVLDAAGLADAVAAAQAEAAAAITSVDGSDLPVGTEYVTPEEKAVLQGAVSAALAVMADPAATQGDIDAARAALGQALEDFAAAKKTAEPASIESVTVYRLYHTTDGEHLYTTSAAERDQILSWGGWNDEGVAWVVPGESSTPVYRVYDRTTGEHHYTASKEERDIILSWGNWNDEGIAWYSDDAQTVPVYRLQNSANYPHAHHYTLSDDERSLCISSWGWNDEGIGWYALATA